mmetsp:Transcript_30961/g.73846  ORF Transcript_30961/g.73846 Transcript_30961/m.73846 type:complete len:222 (+) Transcript_30961:1709-2374(+)
MTPARTEAPGTPKPCAAALALPFPRRLSEPLPSASTELKTTVSFSALALSTASPSLATRPMALAATAADSDAEAVPSPLAEVMATRPDMMALPASVLMAWAEPWSAVVSTVSTTSEARDSIALSLVLLVPLESVRASTFPTFCRVLASGATSCDAVSRADMEAPTTALISSSVPLTSTELTASTVFRMPLAEFSATAEFNAAAAVAMSTPPVGAEMLGPAR